MGAVPNLNPFPAVLLGFEPLVNNPKVLAEGSTTATRSPKLPELRERQKTSWSPGKAERLPPPWHPYGAPKPKGFCWHVPANLLEHPPEAWRAWSAARKRFKIDNLRLLGPGLPGLPRPCSSASTALLAEPLGRPDTTASQKARPIAAVVGPILAFPGPILAPKLNLVAPGRSCPSSRKHSTFSLSRFRAAADVPRRNILTESQE